MQCGLPMLTADGPKSTGASMGPTLMSSVRVSMRSASGMSCQSSLGSPMSTVTRPSASREQRMSPPGVESSTLGLSICFRSRSPTQRAPFPQAIAVLPSGFQMRMIASPAPLGGSMDRSWSKPTPRCRSPMRFAASAENATFCARASITTKSLPSPFIL